MASFAYYAYKLDTNRIILLSLILLLYFEIFGQNMKEKFDLEPYFARPLTRFKTYCLNLAFEDISLIKRFTYWAWFLLGFFIFFGSLFPCPCTTSTYVVRANEGDASWTMIADEGLQLFAYFSEGLGGGAKSSIPREWPIKKSDYYFGPLGMCRVNTISGASACYKGDGLDMPGMIVRDLGTQLGLIGGVEDPFEFGKTTADIYKSAIKEIRLVIEKNRYSPMLEPLDENKTKMMVYLESARLGAKAIKIVWLLLLSLFSSVSFADLMVFFATGKGKRHLRNIWQAIIYVFMILEIAYMVIAIGPLVGDGYFDNYGLVWKNASTIYILFCHCFLTVALFCQSLSNT